MLALRMSTIARKIRRSVKDEPLPKTEIKCVRERDCPADEQSTSDTKQRVESLHKEKKGAGLRT